VVYARLEWWRFCDRPIAAESTPIDDLASHIIANAHANVFRDAPALAPIDRNQPEPTRYNGAASGAIDVDETVRNIRATVANQDVKLAWPGQRRVRRGIEIYPESATIRHFLLS
jgi:hypothetical protein